jgi:hypothetical protein
MSRDRFHHACRDGEILRVSSIPCLRVSKIVCMPFMCHLEDLRLASKRTPSLYRTDRTDAHAPPLPFWTLPALLGLAIYLYVLRFANLEWKLFLLFSIGLMISALVSPLAEAIPTRWQFLIELTPLWKILAVPNAFASVGSAVVCPIRIQPGSSQRRRHGVLPSTHRHTG